MAPKRTEVTREIAAPAAAVWALLTDASGFPAWNPTVLEMDGTIAVGEKIRLRSTANPDRAFKLSVEVMDEPSRMVWASGMPFGMFRGERTYTLAEADGITVFTMAEEFSGWMAGPITKQVPDLTDNFAEFADALKAAAEAG